MHAIETSQLLTRDEVETRFGIPKRFLETCVAKSEGPPIVRVGRLVRYRVSDILGWIELNTTRFGEDVSNGK